jgi:para-nitrobenzyl esterase
MDRTVLSIILSIALLTASLAAQQKDQLAQVRVEQGWLSGTLGSDPSVVVFRGVPFAAPPVGDLRWRAPRQPATWKGVRKADRFSPNPMQEMRERFGPWTTEYQPQGAVSEDCLYLNIWTGAKSGGKKRPVMVYIPGGAFTGGSGNCRVYDGENLAKKGLVVVTINYRVGVLGFLAHPELTRESAHHTSGNYGLLDQMAALQWIKRNIVMFGGDPARVTIMGQSAGAASVHFLTGSPLAKGLFIRAIAQSGSYAQTGPGETLATAEQVGIRFAKAKRAASLAELRAMPAADLTAPAKEEFHFLPIVDGWYLPKSVDDIFAAGEQSDVATLTGWVADEGSFSDDYGKVPVEEFVKRVRQQVGAQADVILKFYPTSTQAEAAESQRVFGRDMAMISMSEWARKRARTGKTNVYTYLFTHPQPGDTQERYQVFHSSELPYIFDNLQHSPRPWTAEDGKLAETMSAYWRNFIVTGDPNGKGLATWPAFKNKPEETMELGENMGSRPVMSSEKLEALKKLFQDSLH